MTRTRFVALLSAITCIVACSPGAPDADTTNETLSTKASAASGPDTVAAKRFVQDFYDWYAPLAANPSPGTGKARALPYWQAMHPERHLAADLVTAFRSDSVARMETPQSPRDIMGGDPFLWSQDPCSPYRVTGARFEGSKILVSVVEACPNTDPARAVKPVVELTPVGDSFEISNVWHGSSSVTALICKQAMEDPRPERRPARCG